MLASESKESIDDICQKPTCQYLVLYTIDAQSFRKQSNTRLVKAGPSNVGKVNGPLQCAVDSHKRHQQQLQAPLSNTKQLKLQFFLKEKTRSHKCKLNSRLTSKPKVTIDDTILQFAKKLTHFFNCLFIGKVTHNLSSSYFSK